MTPCPQEAQALLRCVGLRANVRDCSPTNDNLRYMNHAAKSTAPQDVVILEGSPSLSALVAGEYFRDSRGPVLNVDQREQMSGAE